MSRQTRCWRGSIKRLHSHARGDVASEPQVSYAVRFTPAAARDLQRLVEFLAERDAKAARRARAAIAKGIEFLRVFPFSCRKASPQHPLLRELIISFGANGYVALFEIEDNESVTVLAVRHQREEDFF